MTKNTETESPEALQQRVQSLLDQVRRLNELNDRLSQQLRAAEDEALRHKELYANQLIETTRWKRALVLIACDKEQLTRELTGSNWPMQITPR